jgi:dTDP-glucose 4,6-dehydratase
VHGESGECFHLATPDTVSIRQLVERICRRVGVEFDDAVDIVNERPGKDQAYLLDYRHARARLGWSDSVSLDDGLEDTLAWVDREIDDLRNQPLEYAHKP